MTLRSPGIGMQVTWDTLPGKPSVFTPAPHSHAWNDVTGKPTSFSPSAHSHSWADLTDKPTSFPPLAHSHAWSDISGKPASFAPAAHTHSGLHQFVGDLAVTETLLVSLAVGMKRKTFALAGVAATDKLVLVANGAPTAGCEAINVYPASAGNVSIGYYTPLLGIGATYTIPVSIYRILP